MLRKLRIGGIFVMLALWIVPALAAGEVFTVHGVRVDATAAGAAEARDIALTDGQKIAFDRLMQRLTRQQDWTYLPNPPASEIANLVLGVEVAEERASSTRYIAEVTYAFKPKAVRKLLRSAGIAFSEARAKPALLLAVLETPAGIQLWEDPNPWREAWAKRELSDELVPILLPLNDLADSTLISGQQAITANWAAVSAIAGKYGLENVLIAYAKADGVLGESPLKVQLNRLSAGQETQTQFDFAGGGEAQVQLDNAVEASLGRVYEEWKAATIVVYGQENVITATIWFDSLQDWMTIRRRLEEAPTVTAIEILGFSPEGAQVRLRYVGTDGQLKITLEQSSVLISRAAGFWEIAMAERGLRAPPAGSASEPTSVPAESTIPSMDPVADSQPDEAPPADGGMILAPGVDPDLITGGG